MIRNDDRRRRPFPQSLLKPGRYLIPGPVLLRPGQVRLGSTKAWSGPQAIQTNHYQQYAYERERLLQEIVGITRDNQKVRVSVRNAGF